MKAPHTPYLRRLPDGAIFPWTAALAKRRDMRPLTLEDMPKARAYFIKKQMLNREANQPTTEVPPPPEESTPDDPKIARFPEAESPATDDFEPDNPVEEFPDLDTPADVLDYVEGKQPEQKLSLREKIEGLSLDYPTLNFFAQNEFGTTLDKRKKPENLMQDLLALAGAVEQAEAAPAPEDDFEV